MIDHAFDAVLTHGDLAHLALFVWASGASASALMLFRELAAANRRFDAFVRELHHLNSHLFTGD